MTNPTAAILVIGNEVLSGRTQDANVNFIAKRLSDLGVTLSEVRIIPDIEGMIIEAIRKLSDKYDQVFTTGGIGATHDDITAASIAKAFNRSLHTDPEAVKILQTYYLERLNETRLKMAIIPEGSSLIKNPVSAAPGFQIKNVYCMAGIPAVMQAMFDVIIPTLKTGQTFHAKTIKSFILENDIAQPLTDIQNAHTTVEIGSYPSFLSPGKWGVSLVVRGTDLDAINHSIDDICAMIKAQGHEYIIE
jgi:molybdenum cofactor synthesis domain-containing protein